MLVDTHCHLYFKELEDDLPGVLERASELGVSRFICVGTNLEDSRRSLELAEQYDSIYATAGIHPHDAKDAKEGYLQELETLLSHPKMVACGEMGLDFFRNISEPATQKKVFREQLDLAEKLKKPVIFHNRNADEDIINILSEKRDIKGVSHCFSSTLETANIFITLGFYISFSGNLTFKNSTLPSVAEHLPLDKLLVETDSPFLSPMPHRGKTNEPGRARFVAEKLAEIKGVQLETVVSHTTQNAKDLFGFV